MTRRAFLANVIKAFFAMLVAAAVAVSCYVYPTVSRMRRLHFVFAVDEDELPKRGVRKVEFKYTVDDNEMLNRAFLVAGDNGLIAFSPVCTHLGCYINWDNNRKEFLCPCHGGRYDVNGRVIAGPPPKPLNRLPVKIDSGRVYIGVTI
ncbi:MAG TPA: ubiquinol-cytochrome c reductase iron-sulfur subunit [Dissulfurispiraceae bacterium]|nr:ubiquinol-cytochrome c reductase iron-sulfur subunit [Dissulfurispiraceae bacterium]